MKIHIKNMVCNRCLMVVTNTLRELGFDPLQVNLGEVTLKEELSDEDKARIDEAIREYGFSIIDDKRGRLIESIKNLIVELVQQKNSELQVNLSDYLSSRLHQDYSYMSNLFSEVEGKTIEKYFITQKIEKVKELLVYDELTLSEIAFQLHYSSVAHLSNQFKKITGLTPTHFKKIKADKRRSIDEL